MEEFSITLNIATTTDQQWTTDSIEYNFTTSSENLFSLKTSSYGWSTIVWAFFNILLFILILGGNFLTIIAIRMCRRLRSLVSNLFILSLAVSDFIVGLTLPYHLAFYLGSDFGHMHSLCLTRFFLIIFACCVSVLTLITISIDRYIAIVRPFHYRR